MNEGLDKKGMKGRENAGYQIISGANTAADTATEH